MEPSRPQPWLQICISNRLARRADLLHRLRQAGATVEIVDCLDQCTQCQESCFALVSGVFAYAASPEALCHQVLEPSETK